MDHPEKTSEVIETLLIWLVGRGRILILSVVLFVTLVIAGFAAQVPIESNNSSMVSKSKDLQDNYDTFRKTFGNDEVLLAISHPQLLHAEGLQLLEHTTNDLGALKGATRVLSITNAERLAAGTLGTEADHIAAHSARSEVIIPISVAILGVVLLLMFRRLSGLLLPLAVMAISLCWTIGIYTFCGYALNTITALLPPVIMVLSFSTTVHIYSGWLDSRRYSDELYRSY